MTIRIYLLGIAIVKYKIEAGNGNAQRLRKDLGFKLTTICATGALVYSSTLLYFLAQIYQNILVVSASAQARVTVAPTGAFFMLLATMPRFFVLYFFKCTIQKCHQEIRIANNCCPIGFERIHIKESRDPNFKKDMIADRKRLQEV